MSQLVDTWNKCQFVNPPFTFETDTVSGLQYRSYSEYIDSKDFGVSSSSFHLGLIPQPYIGNLASAKIFLLMLNPGFSSGDYYSQEQLAFRKARLDNLHQRNDRDDYPFFYLNPAFAWTEGGQWWQGKLHSVVTELSNHKKLVDAHAKPYLTALQHVSKHLACLELCPYFSKTYSFPSRLLDSSKLLLDYVRNDLRQQADSSKISAVVLRQSKTWGLPESDNVRWLASTQARGAHLTMNTEAGKFIYDRLASLL